MEKMTIHRGLAELKLIDLRIEKAINAMNPIGINQKDGKVNNFYTKEEFENEATGKYQSVKDLIDRKIKIKSAIVKINGLTEVTVSEKTMTIADAITYRTIIEMKRKLMDKINSSFTSNKAQLEKKNEEVKNVALTNAKIMIGKQDDGTVKATDDDVKAIVEPFIERNEFHFIDPLKAEKLVEKMGIEIDEWETEIDAVLSEINAITLIEI